MFTSAAAAAVYCSSFVLCSMAEKYVKSSLLADKLSQLNIDAMFPSSITLLPPDIARQIELESQKSQAADVDRLLQCLVEI